MAKQVKPMTQGPIFSTMLKFSLPILIGNLFQQLYNTVDALIVGNEVSSSALAAVTSSGSIVFMLIGFFSGIAMGAGVIISKYFGAGDNDNLKISIHTTVAFALCASVFMTFFGTMFTPLMLKWMGTPESVMPESVAYLGIFFSGSLGLIMYNVFVGVLQALGDSKHPLYYLIISSIVNVILDLLFVVGFHWGVKGAATATIISQFMSAILCLIQLMKTKDVYRLVIKDLKVDSSILKQIIKVGLPSGVQNSIVAFANVIVQTNINAFGESAVAGTGAYNKIEGFVFLPVMSFSMAITTFVSQNIGAKQYERTKKGTLCGMVMSVGIAELIGVLVFTLAPKLIAMFDDNPEVIAFGVDRARVVTLFFCFLAFSHSIAAVLRGTGNAITPMLIMMITWCIIRVAFIEIVIRLTNDISVVYWSFPVSWTLSAIIFAFIFLKGDWLKKAISKNESIIKNEK